MSELARAALILALGVGLWTAGHGVADAQAPIYEQIEVDNAGTIAGRVIWVGDIPEVQQLPITKNPEVCDTGGRGVSPSPRLVISEESKGVSNAVVYLAGIERGKALEELLNTELRKAELGPDQNLILDQRQCTYEPHVLVVPVRSKLDMISRDDVLHNIHMHGAARYNLAFPIKEKVITKRLRKGGLVRVACDAGHSWMSAYIHVVNHPYYAITDDSGDFTMTGVPAGKYSVHAWHEGWNIARTETQGDQVTGYVFTEPVILEEEVTVAGGAETQVNFELSNAIDLGSP